MEGREKPKAFSISPDMQNRVAAYAFEQTQKQGKRVSESSIVEAALREYFAAKIL